MQIDSWSLATGLPLILPAGRAHASVHVVGARDDAHPRPGTRDIPPRIMGGDTAVDQFDQQPVTGMPRTLDHAQLAGAMIARGLSDHRFEDPRAWFHRPGIRSGH